MKNIIILIFLLTSSIIISSCIEDDSPEIYTLTGTLFYDCNKVPMANTSLILMGYDGSVFQEDLTGIKGSTTTDENGKFSISYEKQPIRVDLAIETNSGINNYKIMMGFPNNENLNLQDIYFANSASIRIILNTPNPYTEEDTLFYGPGGDYKKYFKNGPFYNNSIDTFNIGPSLQYYNLDLFQQQTGGNYQEFMTWAFKTTSKRKYFFPKGCLESNDILIDLP